MNVQRLAATLCLMLFIPEFVAAQVRLLPAVSHPQGVETIVDLQWLMGERFALWMGPLHMYLLSFWHGHWLVQGGSISPCQSWEGSQRF